MVSRRVRDMAAASALTGGELFYADDGSTDVKVTSDQILTFASGQSKFVLDRIWDTTTTTGTGTLTLAGAPSGFRSFADVYTIIGQRVTALITDGTDWEINRATLATSTPTTNLVASPFSTGFFGSINGGEISDNDTIDPDGTTHADSFVEDASSAHVLENAEVTGFAANSHLTFSVYIKPGTRTKAGFYIASSPVFNNEVQINYNLTGGGTVGAATVLSGAATIFATSIAVAANGFYRCTATVDVGASATTAAWYVFPEIVDDDFGAYAGNNGDTAISVWGFGVWVGDSVLDLTAPLDQLERTQVLASSNNGALVSFAAGTKDVIKTIAGYQVDYEPTVVNIMTYGAVADGVTDDTQAFADFASDYEDQSVELFLPPGTYVINQSGVLNGIYRCTVHGYGAFLTGTAVSLMGSGYIDRGTDPVAVATVEPGDTSLTLVTPADISLFDAAPGGNWEVGQDIGNGISRDGWIMLAGLDLQGYGFPTNQYKMQFLQVTATNGVDTLSLSFGVGQEFLSTWPTYPGFLSTTFPNGGPASVWRVSRNWDAELVVKGVTFLHNTGANDFYSAGLRYAKFVDCTFQPSFFVSQNKQIVFENTRHEDNSFDAAIVIDKDVESATFNECTISRFLMQSSTERVSIYNSSITQRIQGTSKNFLMQDSWCRKLVCGPEIGVNETTTLINNRINEISFNETTFGAYNDHLISLFTLTNGEFTFLNANGPVGWAVPGARCVFIQTVVGGSGTVRWFPDVFWVLSVTQDATNTKIRTTLGASIPGWSGTTPDRIMALPAPRLFASGNVGCREAVDLSNTPPGQSLGTYSNRMITGSQGQFPDQLMAKGRVKQITVNVIRAYTGAGALSLGFWPDTPPGLEYIDMVTYARSFWNVTFDAKTVGKRIIVPGAVNGAQPNDSIPVLPITGAFLTHGVTLGLGANITAETQDKWPLIQVEVITDLGEAVDPHIMEYINTQSLPDQSQQA